MANVVLAGYEMPVSDKLEIICDHAGPASYANVVVNAGAGDVVNAADFNRGGIEECRGGDALSSDGLNFVRVFYTSGYVGNAVPSVSLRWYVLATGAEVANTVNLSAKSVRLALRLV